jgi:DNA-nicking Smr family endonuclease
MLSMDYKLHTKMRQGKIRPEAKLDLHGLNLAQAQPTLTKFILDAHGKGLRLILIITGKGRNSEDNDVIPKRKGVLKASVPNWLSMEPLSSKILQITNAHVKHGGGGAFYVYLRKKK